jgi:hypothetical protein
MKKLLLFGVFALLTTTLFSCTADEYEADKTSGKTDTKIISAPDTPAQALEGPEDDPITVPVPPKK